MKEVILEIKDLDNPFEREKLESLPKDILVELLIRHLKRNIKAIEYIEKHKEPLHHSFDEPDCDYWIATNPDDLLDILRGDDNE